MKREKKGQQKAKYSDIKLLKKMQEKENAKQQRAERKEQVEALLRSWVGCVSGNGSNEQREKIEAQLIEFCTDRQTLQALSTYAIGIAPKDIRKYFFDFFEKPEVVSLLEENASQHGDSARVLFVYGGYNEYRKQQLSNNGKTMETVKSVGASDAQPEMISSTLADQIQSATLADLQKAKKKIGRLEAEIEAMEQDAGKETLINIINDIAPTIAELRLYSSEMYEAGFDTDAIEGYAAALDSIASALVNAGASLIGEIGEEVSYDPTKHFCQSHIAKGTQVIVTASGYSVDNSVIVPATVEHMEG